MAHLTKRSSEITDFIVPQSRESPFETVQGMIHTKWSSTFTPGWHIIGAPSISKSSCIKENSLMKNIIWEDGWMDA